MAARGYGSPPPWRRGEGGGLGKISPIFGQSKLIQGDWAGRRGGSSPPPGRIADYWPVVRTTRKRALPLIMRSYASFTRSSGKISFMERTPARALKASVSWESIEVPEYQPLTERRPGRGKKGETCIEGGRH